MASGSTAARDRPASRRRIWAGLGGAAALGLLAWGLRPGPVPDPIVRGKPLSAWLDQQKFATLPDEATGAVRSLGPEAAPTLLAWLHLVDPALVRTWREVDRKAVIPIGRLTGSPDRFRARARAVAGFRALEGAGRSAWPAVAALVLHSPDENQRMDAINSLTAADGAAARLLAAGTADPDPDVRLRAIFALRCLHLAAAEVTYPTLERLRADPDLAVAGAATRAIGFLDLWIKGAVVGLKDPKPDHRARIARIIGEHGAHARSLLPDLEAVADDPDPAVRATVAEAIRQVRGPGTRPPGARPPAGSTEREATSTARADRP